MLRCLMLCCLTYVTLCIYLCVYLMRVVKLRCATYETHLIFVIYVKLYSRPGPKRREATHVHGRASTKHTRPARASHANAGWTCERHLDTPKTLNAGTGVCEINTHFNLAAFLHVLTPLPVFQSCRKDAGQQLTKMSVYFTRRVRSMCACS